MSISRQFVKLIASVIVVILRCFLDKIIFDKFNNTLSLGGEYKRLGARDSLVLEFLLSSGDQLSAKNDIVEYAWQGITVTDASLSKSISLLRGAFSELAPGIEIIVTVPRLGYKIKHTEIEVKSEVSDVALDQEEHTPRHLNEKAWLVNLSCGISFFKSLSARFFLILRWGVILLSITLTLYSISIFYKSSTYKDKHYQDPQLTIMKLSDDINLLSTQKLPSIVHSKIQKINCSCDVFVYQEDKNSYVSLYLRDSHRAVNILISNDQLDNVDSIVSEILSKKE